MKSLRVLAATAFTLLTALSASADLNYEIGGDPGEPKFVIVAGEFSAQENLQSFADIVLRNNVKVVGFNSPGGSVMKAMELGRIIRSNGLTTLQLRGLECSSACSLAFMGGRVRMAEPGSIGVHKSSFSSDSDLSAKDAVSVVQHLTAEVISYMMSMGVDPALLQLSLKYEADDVRYLSGSEMREYRVTTVAEGGAPSDSRSAAVSAQQTQRPNESREGPNRSEIPIAQTGRVLHPKGGASLKIGLSDNASDVTWLSNGEPVQIIDNVDRWYKVRSRSYMGYLHHTWVYVDQYESGPYGQRHIQIKSAKTAEEVVAFSKVAKVPINVYLATNGWFAITVEGTFEQSRAAAILVRLKDAGSVPKDSFTTFGTTYVKKMCCN